MTIVMMANIVKYFIIGLVGDKLIGFDTLVLFCFDMWVVLLVNCDETLCC